MEVSSLRKRKKEPLTPETWLKLLKQRMNFLGMDHAKIGQIVGITGQAVSNILSGNRVPSAELLFRLCEALQFTSQKEMTEYFLTFYSKSVDLKLILEKENNNFFSNPDQNSWIFSPHVWHLLLGGRDDLIITLRNGHKIYYFIPWKEAYKWEHGYADTQRSILLKKLPKEIIDNFRVYATSDSLCHLNVVITNPEVEVLSHASVDFKFDKFFLGKSGLFFDPTVNLREIFWTEDLIEEIIRIIREIDETGQEFNGYKRIF